MCWLACACNPGMMVAMKNAPNPLPFPLLLFSCVLLLSAPFSVFGEPRLNLDDATRERCIQVLRAGLRSDEFWPSIHAAEGLTIGGLGKEVRAFLEPKLEGDFDDRQLCGISRELARAGDREKTRVMLEILAGDDPFGHIHAAESLFKVDEIGDGVAMRRAFEKGEDVKLRLMAAAALGKKGEKRALQFLRENLASSDDPDAIRISAWILARIGGKQDIEPIRARLKDAPSPIVRAYLEHALASLGDEAGLAALSQNLESTDPAIRTYAATFAGDARAVSVAPKLTRMLDDSNLDARIRAAQSLLDLAR